MRSQTKNKDKPSVQHTEEPFFTKGEGEGFFSASKEQTFFRSPSPQPVLQRQGGTEEEDVQTKTFLQTKAQAAVGKQPAAFKLTPAQGAVPARIQRSKLEDYKDPTKPNHDPAKLSDATIEATKEFKAYMAVSNWLAKYPILSIFAFSKEQARLACRLLVRHLREGNAMVWKDDSVIFLVKALKQLGAAKQAEKLVGNLDWVPFSTAKAKVDPTFGFRRVSRTRSKKRPLRSCLNTHQVRSGSGGRHGDR